jgi:UDP-N-acetyl-2-amino-2-deoxyglucuronate dehydrogenase
VNPTLPVLRRAALVGCGRSAEEAHVPALLRLRDRIAVVAVCDPSADRRERLGDLLQVEPRLRFEEFGTLLSRVAVDLVDVATSAGSHLPVVIAASDAGKHVLCEPPLASTLESADRALRAADAAGVSLGVIHDLRYEPSVRRALCLVSDGAVGFPFAAHFDFASPRPAELEARDPDLSPGGDVPAPGCWMAHGYPALYLSREFMGSDVTAIQSFMGTYVHAIDVEDHASALLRHRNGGITTIRASWALPGALDGRVAAIQIHGTEGSLEIRTDAPRVTLRRPSPAATELVEVPDGADRGVAEAISDFLEALDAKQPPPVTGDEARRNLRVVLAGYEAAKANRVVSVA